MDNVTGGKTRNGQKKTGKKNTWAQNSDLKRQDAEGCQRILWRVAREKKLIGKPKA